MRILYFHQYFTTPRGSSGTRSYEMARHLVARGHDVMMVCGSAARAQTGLTGEFRRGRRRGTVDGIEVVEFDLGYSNDCGFLMRTFLFLRFAMRSAGVALTEPCDLVFATSTPLTAGIPGIAARWLRRRPFVFEVRDLWPELPREMGVIRSPVVLWSMSVLEWVSYRSANRLIGLSPGIVDGIKRRVGRDAPVCMIPNGCDLDLFGSPGEAWLPPGADPSDLIALFSGAHGIANGLHAVLDAAAELQRRGRHDIKVLLVGDGKLKPQLMERAQEEKLQNVVFHPPVEKVLLSGLMAQVDVGLQILDDIPAFYDGTSPNKFFDYLSAGLPVLINYPGWLARLVTDEACGFVVPPRDPTALADALIEASDHRDRLPVMGRRARALAERDFGRPDLADLFSTWIEGATSR